MFDQIINSVRNKLQPKVAPVQQKVSSGINSAVESASRFFPSVGRFVQKQAQTAYDNWKQKESNKLVKSALTSLITPKAPVDHPYNKPVSEVLPKTTPQWGTDMAKNASEDPSKFKRTVGGFFGNQIVQPALDVPKNTRTLFDPTKGKVERGIAGLQAVGGLIPGVDDAIIMSLLAAQNKLAGKSFEKGFTGDEFTGLGTLVNKGGTLETPLNFAGLLLPALAGKLKPKQLDEVMNASKNADLAKQATNVPTAPKQAVETITQPRGMESIRDIMARKIQNNEIGSTIKSDNPKFDYDVDLLTRKTTLSPEYIKRSLQKYTPQQVYSAFKYAEESPTPVKNMEAYVTKSLQTKNFSQPSAPGTKQLDDLKLEPVVEPENLTQDKNYLDSLFRDAPKVELVKQVESKPLTEMFRQRTKYEQLDDILKNSEALDVDTTVKQVGDISEDIVKEIENSGMSFDEFVKARISGTVPPELKNANDKLTNIFKKFLDVGQKRTGKVPSGKIDPDKYFPERTKEMLDEEATDSLGRIFSKQSYLEHRTGKLEAEDSYVKSIEAIQRYVKETMGSNDPLFRRKQKVVNNIIDVERKRGDIENVITTGFRKSQDVVKQLQDVIDNPKQFVYGQNLDSHEVVAGLKKLFVSNNDRATAIDKLVPGYWDNTVGLFAKAQVEINKAIKRIENSNLPTKDKSIEMTRVWRQYQQEAVDKFVDFIGKSDFKSSQVKNLTNDIFDEYVLQPVRNAGVIEKGLNFVRAQVGRAALGLNVSSAVMNITEIKRVASLVNPQSFKNASKRVLGGEDLRLKYGVDTSTSTAAERGANKTWKDFLDKYDKGLFYMFDKSEGFKDKYLLTALEENGIAKGLDGDALFKYVIQNFDKYAIKYGTGNNIAIFRNPLAKTVLQFGQYPIKDFNIFLEKAIGVAKKDAGDIEYIKKYALGQVVQNGLFYLTLGTIGFGGASGSPLDILNSRGVSVSPAASTLINGYKELVNSFGEDERSDYDKYQSRSDLQRDALLLTGLPVNQLWNKTGKTAINQSRGYQETYSGNVANPVSKDPLNVGKTLLFGPSYDPKRQEYVKNIDKSPSLNKGESAVFKKLPEDERQTYYDKSQEIEGVKTQVKKVEKGENSMFLKDLFKKKEVKSVIPSKESTYQEKKVYDDLLDARLSAGDTLNDEEINFKYFRNLKFGQSGINQMFDKVNTIFNDEYPDEHKEAVLKASGLNPDEFRYYRASSLDDSERRQLLISMANQEDRKSVMLTLLSSKMIIGNKSLMSSTDVDYLYDQGLISKDEKKLINAIKYDELMKKYYVDKDFKSDGTGKRKLTKTDLNKLFAPKASRSTTIKTGAAPLINYGTAPKKRSSLTGKNRWIQ